jgi:hypothetical protein
MSRGGAHATTRAQIGREIVAEVSAAFQPVYERIRLRAQVAEERSQVMQTALELIATGKTRWPKRTAKRALKQLGVKLDIDVADDAEV